MTIFGIDWTIKPSVNCWTCDHFQRFDEKEEPKSCAGECRKNPPLGFLDNTNMTDWYQFPVVIAGPLHWCGSWQRTTETPLPPTPTYSPPVLKAQNPQNGEFKFCFSRQVFDFPDDFEDWIPWNRKLKENISCWHCDHFQRVEQKIVPTSDCAGECRKNPPAPVVQRKVLTTSILLGFCVPIFFGPLYWCGDFQRSINEIPPIPEKDGKLCGLNPCSREELIKKFMFPKEPTTEEPKKKPTKKS